MTKTEAAKTMAIDVRVWSRRTGNEATYLMCQERISERSHESYAGSEMHDAARLANPRTVWRMVQAMNAADCY